MNRSIVDLVKLTTGTLLCLLCLGACRPPASALEAQRLLDRGDYASAERKVREGLASEPGSDPLWRMRIRLGWARNRPAEAVAAYRERLAAHGESDGILRYLAIAALEWGLEHRDPTIRIAAIQAARETDASALAADVADRLQDPDELVRTWASVALAGTREGVDVLERQLRSPSPRARAVAVAEVGRLAGASALGTLARFVIDPDPAVRAAAATALGATRKREAVPHLLRLVEDSEGTVRSDALTALAELGGPERAPAFRKHAGDPYLGARLAAATGLAALRDGGARDLLRELARGDDLSLALRAGQRLAKLGEVQPALDAIAKSLVDRRWTLRVAACVTAASLGDPVAVELAVRALRDREPRVRLAAARAVLARRKLDPRRAIDAARAIERVSCRGDLGRLTAEAGDLCLQAAELLSRAGEPTALLSRIARAASSPELRSSALRAALVEGADRKLAVDALSDGDGRVVIAAASWLYRQLR
jgi:HEAT repeat protein